MIGASKAFFTEKNCGKILAAAATTFLLAVNDCTERGALQVVVTANIPCSACNAVAMRSALAGYFFFCF